MFPSGDSFARGGRFWWLIVVVVALLPLLSCSRPESRQEVIAYCAQDQVYAEPILREGDLKPELRKLLQEDTTIKLVVLAAATPPSGPGPLVSQLGKSGGLAPRPVPVVVVPGALTRDEIRALALPMAAAVSTESTEEPPAPA